MATTINDLFPSRYLKSADIGEQDLVLTIKAVEVEDMVNDNGTERKPVLYFREVSKGLVLNRTNADVISQLYGPAIDSWPGKQIMLYLTEVTFRGKTSLGIRVRLRSNQAQNRPPAQVQQREAQLVSELGFDVPAVPEPDYPEQFPDY